MVHISKAQIKLVRSLQHKKFRDEQGLFVAEGGKCIEELSKAFELEYLIVDEALPTFNSHFATLSSQLAATRTEIEQMSSLRTPQGIIGVFKKSMHTNLTTNPLTPDLLILALDGIQDPGNLGTIIRTCDWFGVHDVFCSPDTADCYNPKVVQATMGALARVHVHYLNLQEWLGGLKTNIYGTLLDGRNMYDSLPTNPITTNPIVVIMGNEGNGISPEVRHFITHPIRIPSFPPGADTSESLNVSIATAIVLAEFRRPNLLTR